MATDRLDRISTGSRPVTGVWTDAVAAEGTGRVEGIDALRGLAIVAMIVANAAGVLLAEPHPFALRAFGSVAAPIFVTLAGLMVGLAAAGGRRTLFDFVKRGAGLVLVAAVLDIGLVGWLPMMTFDVLYIVGLSLPLAFLVARGPLWLQWTAPLTLFALTPILQAALGYRVEMPLVDRATPPVEWLSLVPDAARRFGVDGWFPMFPWLGFALFGVLLERWRREPQSIVRPDARLALLLMAFGGLLWWLAPGPMETRKGYSELFYPPSLGYILTAAGLVLGLLATSQRWGQSPAGMMLQPLGRSSLFLYLAHLVLLELVWHPLFGRELELGEYVSATSALAMLIWVLAAWLSALKATLRDRGVRLPGAVLFLLGG